MCQDVCIVQREHLQENGKARVLIAHVDFIRIVIDRAVVLHAQVARTHVKKVQNQ